MARKKTAWTSEDWFYASELLVGLANTLPPVLGATAQLTHTIGKATAEHESRMRELELHEQRMRSLMRQTIDTDATPVPRKRRRR